MNNDNNQSKFEAAALIFKGVQTVFGGVLFSSFTFWIFIKGADTFTKVAILPFLICGIAVLINGISVLIQGLNMKKTINNIESGTVYDESKVEETHNRMEKINKFSDNLYLYGFLTFWFGFLIVFDYFAIKDWANGGSTMFFVSLTFWAAGLFMLFKKRR